MALFGQQDNVGVGVPKNEDEAQKKREAAARFRERKAEKDQRIYGLALKLKDEITSGGFFERLSQGSKDFLLELCIDPKVKVTKVSTTSGPSILTKLFGENPKVGDSVTLDEVFKQTYKGKATMDIIIRRWANKGIVTIEFEGNTENFGESKYVIKAIG